jgi:hypothetical protein
VGEIRSVNLLTLVHSPRATVKVLPAWVQQRVSKFRAKRVHRSEVNDANEICPIFEH